MNPPLVSRGIELNDVKTAGCLIHLFFAQIPHRRLYNLALLSVVYRFCWKSATDASSCLYLDKDQGITIFRDQINLLRVVDNERYPAFFEWMGQRYRILIQKDE